MEKPSTYTRKKNLQSTRLRGSKQGIGKKERKGKRTPEYKQPSKQNPLHMVCSDAKWKFSTKLYIHTFSIGIAVKLLELSEWHGMEWKWQKGVDDFYFINMHTYRTVSEQLQVQMQHDM